MYSELRPGMLADLGLAATIEWQTSEFSRRSGIPCRVVRLDDVTLPDKNSRLTLYKVFQEAFGNAAGYSGATGIEVSVTGRDGHIAIRIEDNGRGIADERLNSPSSLSLAAIRERLQSHGGQFDIRTGDAGGTVVEATVPLAKTAD